MRWWRFSLGHDEVAIASLMARGRDEAMEHIFGPKRQRSDEARWEHISVAAGGPKRTLNERSVKLWFLELRLTKCRMSASANNDHRGSIGDFG